MNRSFKQAPKAKMRLCLADDQITPPTEKPSINYTQPLLVLPSKTLIRPGYNIICYPRLLYHYSMVNGKVIVWIRYKVTVWYTTLPYRYATLSTVSLFIRYAVTPYRAGTASSAVWYSTVGTSRSQPKPIFILILILILILTYLHAR